MSISLIPLTLIRRLSVEGEIEIRESCSVAMKLRIDELIVRDLLVNATANNFELQLTQAVELQVSNKTSFFLP